MAINGIGTTGGLSVQQLFGGSSGAGCADAVSAPTNDSSTTTASSDASGADSAASDLRKQIETAVAAALEKLDPSSSKDDVLAAVHQAVRDTLQANGFTPPQDGAAANGAGRVGGHPHHHHHGGGARPSGDAASPDGSQSGTDVSGQDLFSILASSDDGSSDASTSDGGGNSSGFNLDGFFAKLFAGFPKGSGVDVTA